MNGDIELHTRPVYPKSLMTRLVTSSTGLLMKAGRGLARCLPEDALSQVPDTVRASNAVRRFVRAHAFPSRNEWIQVQEGFARGIWLNINFAEERTWWAGTHEPFVQQALTTHLRSNMVAYDLGNHIGFYALPMAEWLVRPSRLKSAPKTPRDYDPTVCATA